MKRILGLATGLFLSVLAADLLGLYYYGRWYDPNPLIEMSEVVILYIIFFMGIAQAILVTKLDKLTK